MALLQLVPLFAGIEFDDDLTLLDQRAGWDQAGDLKRIPADGRSREHDRVAGAQFTDGVNPHINLTALDYGKGNLVWRRGDANPAGSDHRAHGRDQNNPDNYPDKDGASLHDSRFTPFPKDL